ncbi:MAG TPA: ATP-dependent zinc metalloprotease FtsH [Candidatus Merdisoma faecalis]|uniref:ATP-dependent zinc metalloprotease FtsH n=1 Tax=Lachnoclostridium sp. An138 TaxID=1965560 RepID=UPI000B3A86F8|nr:ATP-dependent zinc metalloprotease FtsH [Lachnoclostridium sp. An138]OUQ19946.1 AAA family ATPase [Lachnoclostridium sp. An138]HIR97378.1 ATP-dependent zinc metalloprotease FtsH [Candidatus Merdisoma faecalis]
MEEHNNNSGRPPGGGDDNKNPRNRQSILMFLIIALVAILFWNFIGNMGSSSEEITYDEFIQMLDEDKVESVEIGSSQINIISTEKDALGRNITYYTGTVPDYSLQQRLDEADVEYFSPVEDFRNVILSAIVNFLLPVLLLWGAFALLMRRMGGGSGMMGMNVGKSKAKVYIEKDTGVTFKDVAGEEEAKESLQEVVDFLHNPGKYAQIGAKLPKGALLVGPPGTGKTLLAKAVAGEAHVPFFSLSGSDFVEMFVGVGASRVRDLFQEAKKHSPCIIFIDEIDAIGKSRDSRYGGNDEREQTLNQLLAEMDGFDSHTACLVLGATNRPEVLDPALLRPGRFDRRVIVDRPDLKGRVDILKVHSKNVKMDETVDLEAIALATSGAVGSDLANMINEAAILAVKNGRQAVSQKDLFESVEVVLVGKEKKDRIMSKEERRIVSYHEVGHALVSALQKDAEPVQKITIVPRTMGALGYVMQVPEEEKYLNTKKEIDAMLVGLLAGRAAEEIVFDTVTTGAANDIEKATRIARAMVTQYGMSEKFGLMGLEHQENEYLTGRVVMNCGDATAAEVDQEVMKILKKSYEEAKRLLSENRDAMDKIAEYLIQKETITGKEFMKIFREVKGIPEPEEKKPEESSHAQVKAEVPRPESLQPEKEQEEAAPLNAENTEAEQSGAAQNAEPENGGHVEDAEKQNEEM